MDRVQLNDVEPLLSRALQESERPRTEAAVAMMWSILSARYSLESLEDPNESLVSTVRLIIASALDRRLTKPNAFIAQETAGPFSVRWSSDATTGGWFLPSELADLDRVFGGGGTRSYRTPAPAGVRFGNPLSIEERRSVWPW